MPRTKLLSGTTSPIEKSYTTAIKLGRLMSHAISHINWPAQLNISTLPKNNGQRIMIFTNNSYPQMINLSSFPLNGYHIISMYTRVLNVAKQLNTKNTSQYNVDSLSMKISMK